MSRIFLSKRERANRDERLDKLNMYETVLISILKKYGIKNVEIKKVTKELFRIPIKKSKDKIPKLEFNNYAYKGGVARAILQYELGISDKISYRDVDLVRLTESDVNGMDSFMSRKYMTEDFERGYGVEKLEKDYFKTREFTINEVFAVGDYLYCTKQCLLDSVRRIIRFTDFKKKELHHKREGFEEGFFVNDKLMAKALRLCASWVIQGKKAEIADNTVYRYLYIKSFHIALQLDRALEQGGMELAMEYVSKLIENNQWNSTTDNLDEVVMDIIDYCKDDFDFRYAPVDVFNSEEDLFEVFELIEEYDDTISYFTNKYQDILAQIDQKYYGHKY